MSIPFTQYLLPNGERRETSIERPSDIEAKAQAIIDAGFRFECEMLTTGAISLTISSGEDDVAMEVCTNGPAVLVAVDRLVTKFVIPDGGNSAEYRASFAAQEAES
jgi:hypothetical protein